MPLLLPREGDGFLLRLFTGADAEPLAEIEFDPEVKRFLALPTKNKDQWLRDFDPDLMRGWAVEVGGRLAGRASILRAKRKGDGELAIVIGRSYWGKRLGRKVAAMVIPVAFAELNAKALVAIVHPENQASIDLLGAFKFRHRGTVKAPTEHWQAGHLVYRLSRGAYNTSIERMAKRAPN